MSRSRQLFCGLCLVSAALQTAVYARGFAGIPAQDRLGIPARGFMGFPTGGVGGFAGGHMHGIQAVGMPGRNEFDTLVPVTLPNLRADGRLHPYGMPPMGVFGDFHPGGLPGMGGFAGLHPVNMPDVFSTTGLRMGGTITKDGGSARLADNPVQPGSFATGHLRTDLPTVPARTNSDPLQTFVSQPDEFESQTNAFKTLSAVNRFAGMPTDVGMHTAGQAGTGRGVTSGKTHAFDTRMPNMARAADSSSALKTLNTVDHLRGLPTDVGQHVLGQKPTERGVTPRETRAVETRVPSAVRPAETGPIVEEAPRNVVAAPSRTAADRHEARDNRLAAGSHGTVGNWLAASEGGNNLSAYHHAASSAVSRWFVDHAVYTPTWCDTHAWAWYPAAYQAAAWSRIARTVTTWEAAAQWLDWESQPVRADDDIHFYGLDNPIDDDPQTVANVAEDYEQANTLANLNRDTPDSQDDRWLPLGVFGLVPPGQQQPELIFQLAINQQGVIRGNAYDQAADGNLPVCGTVDQVSQQAAWTVGNSQQLVVTTGLYNLTIDKAQAWVHCNAGTAAPYLMIREHPPREESSQERP